MMLEILIFPILRVKHERWLMDSHACHSPVAVPLQILRLHEVRRLAAHSVQMLLLRGFGYETAYLRGL